MPAPPIDVVLTWCRPDHRLLASASTMSRRILIALLILLFTDFSHSLADERTDHFEKYVRPLLIQHCVECHGPKKQESGLRLDSQEQVIVGNDDQDALVDTTNPSASRLLEVIAWSDDDVQMPPDKPLSEAAQTIIQEWIKQGAAWPKSSNFGQTIDHQAMWKEHWAFQPVSNPEPPGPGHPIDAFVRHRLSESGIEPSKPATTRVLVRRLSIALTGLPPTIDDLEAAAQLSAPATNAWLDKYVLQQLASPHFGERWARYWMDVSRYSDTKGYVFQEDRTYPDAWRYREWLITAFDDDMPWDEFLTRQLAADRFPDDQTPEDLAAMGFLTLGRRFLNNIHDIIDDRIDVTMRGMMGITVACARCHDHKFDPVPTADYYSLYGVFNSSNEPKDAPSPLRLVDRPKPREPVIFVRGSAGRRGDAVPRQFLTAFTNGEPKPFTDGSGRLELAKAIASRDNPLTARVAVNRIWSHLFAEPIVSSPSDFGIQSDPPSHPDLLDHLATWFMDHDWSVKQLIRYVVTSKTWQQSSDRRVDLETIDPENRLLARMPKTRLDFEAHRDAILSVSGKLNTAIGGESTNITSAPFTNRRTIYAHIDRQNLPGVFRTFDFASPDTHAPKRFNTTVPQQALFQMNSPFILNMAKAATQETTGQPHEIIEQLYRRILQRNPTDEEVAAAEQFIATDSPDQPTGWTYGYGTISESFDELKTFEYLPSFHKDTWQGGMELPDPKTNWVLHMKDSGHPGDTRSLCSVRRWTAGRPATLSIQYQIAHNNKSGDGVTSTIFHNQTTALVTRTTKNTRTIGVVKNHSVQPGDTIDFVVFCGKDATHDTFKCSIKFRETAADNSRAWNSVTDFSDQNELRVTDAWTQLAQVLMLTNEFVFVD
jgi:hypothetical protein